MRGYRHGDVWMELGRSNLARKGRVPVRWTHARGENCSNNEKTGE